MLRNIICCINGNFGILTALLIPILLLGAGFAVDYSVLTVELRRAQESADAAALAAAIAYNKGISGEDALLSLANSHVVGNMGSGYSIKDMAITRPTATDRRVKVTGKVNVPLYFGSLWNMPSKDIAFSASASVGSSAYSQIVFLVDVSNSMSIPGTDSDMVRWQAVSGGCQFACHDSLLRKAGYKDGVQVAKEMGIKLKMDFIRSSMAAFAARAKSSGQTGLQTYSVYTVGTTFNALLENSSSADQLATIGAALEVEPTFPPGVIIGPGSKTDDGWSFLEQGLRLVRPKIRNIGDGSSAAKRNTYFVFLTDGLDSTVPARTFGPFYDDECTALRSDGVEIFTVQTYYPPSGDVGVQEAFERIPAAIEACASKPENHFMADNGIAIGTALDKIYSQVMGKVRLVQ
ncbi:pilus assembly protein TadG-related protein [Rhizobium sp. FKY42]|uniref:pilus assembly protein TadG-related protein n=1 Tax=Rhizobium sp. FKY42 TaxID=2562310 RepID=UPI00148563E6|nr:pilus assembly protein TadG-related protein [Rhizobium sp. FKY42]